MCISPGVIIYLYSNVTFSPIVNRKSNTYNANSYREYFIVFHFTFILYFELTEIMDSSKDDYHEDTIKELKNTIDCQKDKINNLKRQLDSYEEVVAERNELRDLRIQLEEWKENILDENKKAFIELLTVFNVQSEKLKQVATDECKWQIKYSELLNLNNCLADKLKALKSNEVGLQSKISESEKNQKNAENALYSAKEELEETHYEIKKLNVHLKFNEEEICKVRGQLDECAEECNRIKETNRTLEMDLKCTKSKLADEKLCTSRMEEKFKIEREILSNEVKIKCMKLSDAEAQNDEANCKIIDGKSKIKLLTTTLKQLKDASDKSCCELKKQIQTLNEENCSKDDEISRLKKQVKKLQSDCYGNNTSSGKWDSSREC